MSQKKKKSKNKNKVGRKNPAFCQCVRRVNFDCQMTIDEITALKKEEDPDYAQKRDDMDRLLLTNMDLPEEANVVDTLNGHYVFHNTRLFRHIDLIAEVLREFSDEFWDEHGLSVLDLRRDKKNRVWADDQTILQLAYIAIAMGLAQWTKPRNQWRELPGGMPMIKFLFPKEREEPMKTSTEETVVQSNEGAQL